MADEQVQQAVVVVIQPCRAGAPVVGRTADTGLRGHVFESSVPIVVEQMIAADAGYDQVLESVVVVVADRNAHAVETHVEPGPGGDVGEMSFALVVVEGVGGWLFAFRNVPGP